MTLIAHLSDLHFGSEDEATTAALVDALNGARHDLVILSGDLTMAARSSEFERARAFIDALEAPTLTVPGNHDITPYKLIERFTRPYARWREHIGALETRWWNEDVAVVGVNTARRMRLRLDWSHGVISRAQMDALGERFKTVPGRQRFRIVVAHHPFMEEEGADLEGRPRVMVKRADEALRVFAQNKVDLVTAGHLHRTYAAAFESVSAGLGASPQAGSAKGAAARSHAALPHRVTVIQAGTALSSRTRKEKNSFNRIAIEDARLSVHPVEWDGAAWSVRETPLVVLDKGRPLARASVTEAVP